MSTDREPARIGDALVAEIRWPQPYTLRLVLETPESVAYANEVLQSTPETWRVVRAAAAIAQEPPCPKT